MRNYKLPFEVWRESRVILAKFCFLQEALDYIEYANKRGSVVILRSWNGKGWTKKLYRPGSI